MIQDLSIMLLRMIQIKVIIELLHCYLHFFRMLRYKRVSEAGRGEEGRECNGGSNGIGEVVVIRDGRGVNDSSTAWMRSKQL